MGEAAENNGDGVRNAVHSGPRELTPQAPPKVFISYSHDSSAHRERVLGLSERLREDGVDTSLDQYVSGTPKQGWPRWILDQVGWADRVLIVCTETYYRRFRGQDKSGRGQGVDFEGAIFTNQLYASQSNDDKFALVLFEEGDKSFVPEPLTGSSQHLLTSEPAYKELYDLLLRQSGVEPRRLGQLQRRPRGKGKPLRFAEFPPDSLDNSPTGDASELELPPKPVPDLVDDLVEELSLLRGVAPGSADEQAHRRRADALTAAIKQGFQPQEGTVVAGAKLIRVIGTGNFGTVWEAVQDDGKAVAVKVFHLHRLTEGQMLARFRRSIRALRILSEPKRIEKHDDSRGSIVPFYQADDSQLAFSMKLLPGGDLERLESFGWSLEKKLQVLISVCAAVRYAHANGVIHRDIKPANVVLDERGEPVLTDFDIAYIKYATRLSTAAETALGTAVFVAPEQLEGDSATELSDIYSLGRLLYFFLLERSPGFQIERDPNLDNLQLHPPALVEVVRKATQHVPRRRFESVEAMIQSLERCQTGSALWAARLVRSRRWVWRNRWLLLFVAVVLSASVASSIYQASVAAKELELRADAEKQRARAELQRERAEKARADLARLGENLDELKKREANLTERRASLEKKLAILKKERKQARGAAMSQLDDQIAATTKELSQVRKALKKIEEDTAKLERSLKAARVSARWPLHSSALEGFEADPQVDEGFETDPQVDEGSKRPVRYSCSQECAELGLCAIKDGECTAALDAHCAKSRACMDFGLCTASAGICVATTYVGCVTSVMCSRLGHCAPINGRCRSASNGHCIRSEACSSDGRCTAKGGECVAASNADCRKSSMCAASGRCGASHGRCVLTDYECAIREACSVYGLCSARGTKCIAVSSTDCAKSTGCIMGKRCTAKNGECVAVDAD